MAKKSLNMMEKMMDPNKIDYYIINCAIPSINTIENRYQIDFGKPAIGQSYALHIVSGQDFNPNSNLSFNHITIPIYL